jgi:ribosome-binding factor A
MSLRIAKINELIKTHINDILLKDLSLKGGVFITIAKVDTSPDLRYTHISLSVFPESDRGYVMSTLKKEMYKIQGILNKKLSMRPLPRADFRLDVTESKADNIEKLLKEIQE